METMEKPRTMQPGATNRGVASIWEGTIRDRRGRLKGRTKPHPNLRTQGGADWQSGQMAGAVTNNVAQRTATGATASTLTDTGAAFPTTNNISNLTASTGGLVGQIVCVGATSAGAGSTVYGVIVSNTATVLTVDRWIAAGSPFAARRTPARHAVAQYQVLPVYGPAWFMALSTTVQAGANTDSALSGECTSGGNPGFQRANATTITHTLASAAYSLAKTFTCGATTTTVNSEAVLNASGTQGLTNATGGVMVFEAAEPSAPTLVNGDTLAQTVTVNY